MLNVDQLLSFYSLNHPEFWSAVISRLTGMIFICNLNIFFSLSQQHNDFSRKGQDFIIEKSIEWKSMCDEEVLFLLLLTEIQAKKCIFNSAQI
jgi:hypothetical protein